MMMWLLSEHHIPAWEYNKSSEGEKFLTRLQYEMIMEARQFL